MYFGNLAIQLSLGCHTNVTVRYAFCNDMGWKIHLIYATIVIVGILKRGFNDILGKAMIFRNFVGRNEIEIVLQSLSIVGIF